MLQGVLKSNNDKTPCMSEKHYIKAGCLSSTFRNTNPSYINIGMDYPMSIILLSMPEPVQVDTYTVHILDTHEGS